jgi:hypothetical protein
LGVWAARRQPRAVARLAAVFAVGALLLGVLDRLTWGHWFQSAFEYLRFNIAEGRSAAWGTSGPAYYALVLGRSMPVLMLVAGPLAVMGFTRSPALAATLLLFVAAHALAAHKELRFLLPALPLLLAAAALGASALQPQGLAFGAGAALALAALFSGLRAHRLTFGDLGQYEDLKPRASAYDDFGSVNRLLMAAGARPDLCGLKVEGVHLAWTGGYTYLHRKVPLYAHSGPSRAWGMFNYVVTPAPALGRAAPVARDGEWVLGHLGFTGCRADPGFSWVLP